MTSIFEGQPAYIYIYAVYIYLFVHLFIYLFIYMYLFMYLSIFLELGELVPFPYFIYPYTVDWRISQEKILQDSLGVSF